MAKKISDCAGARVHFAFSRKDKDGNRKLTWKVMYKNDSIWVNSREDLIRILDQIAPVAVMGEEHKTWEVGKDGWQKNQEKK